MSANLLKVMVARLKDSQSSLKVNVNFESPMKDADTVSLILYLLSFCYVSISDRYCEGQESAKQP